jgi:hypothetical protein
VRTSSTTRGISQDVGRTIVEKKFPAWLIDVERKSAQPKHTTINVKNLCAAGHTTFVFDDFLSLANLSTTRKKP